MKNIRIYIGKILWYFIGEYLNEHIAILLNKEKIK